MAASHGIHLRGTLAALGCLIGCLIGAPAPVAAQTATAAVAGVVAGVDGRRLEHATVEVRSLETGMVRRVVTTAQGAYRLPGLPPGGYEITARALGYRAGRRPQRDLVVGATARVDFALAQNPGAIELDPIMIAGDAPTEIERRDVSTAVDERQIERLPLNSRDALALAAVAPGVRTYAPEAGRALPAAGALASARLVNLYVDGSEWKGLTGGFAGVPNAGSLIPQEAIREFRIALNPYDAELTRGASYVVSAVTHQGGNAVHGSIFAYGQDRDLVARGTFDAARPQYQRSQVGINLRGPLARDRLFYAVSYEGQLTDNYVDVVPGRPSYDPTIWDRYAGTFRAPIRNHLAMARLTGILGSHTLDAIWLRRRLTTVGNFGIQAGGYLQSHEAAVTSAYSIGSTELRDRWTRGQLINELSLHLLEDRDSDAPLVPGVVRQYPGIQTGRASYPSVTLQRAVTVTERVSYPVAGVGGEHALKGGVELSRTYGAGYQPSSRDGVFTFPRDTSTLPSSAQIGIGYPDATSTEGARAHAMGTGIGAYVQDEWRPSARLAVTLGVRYDADINTLNQGRGNPWSSDTTLQRIVGARTLDARRRRNDLDNLAPRIAASWDVSGGGRTSVRAGYGVMYDRIPRTGAFLERVSWSWRTYTFTNPGTTDPAELRRRVAANQGRAVPNVQLLPEFMETPEARQWSLGVGQRLGDHLSLQMDLLDQRMIHLPVTVRENGARQLTNRFGTITVWGSFGDARYRGLLTSLTYDHGPSRLTAAYTLGWSEAEFLGLANSDYPDSASYRMQWSNGDERHRVVLSGMTGMPFGVELSTIAIVASPHPYAVTVGTDLNRSGVIGDDWPDGIRSARPRGWSHWYRVVDVRIGKRVGAQAARLLATLDVFNLLNTANHAEYGGNQLLATYGEPIGDYARRQAQLGVRYSF